MKTISIIFALFALVGCTSDESHYRQIEDVNICKGRNGFDRFKVDVKHHICFRSGHYEWLEVDCKIVEQCRKEAAGK